MERRVGRNGIGWRGYSESVIRVVEGLRGRSPRRGGDATNRPCREDSGDGEGRVARGMGERRRRPSRRRFYKVFHLSCFVILSTDFHRVLIICHKDGRYIRIKHKHIPVS